MRVTPPALVGEAAVEWFRLMPHEVVWVVHPGRESASPMLADGTGSGLTAAFDAVLGDLHARAGAGSSAAARVPTGSPPQRDALRARLSEVPPSSAARGVGCSPGFAVPRTSDWIAPWVTGCI